MVVPYIRCALAAAAVGLLLAGCGGAPAKRYALQGQILAVYPDQKRLTIKHGDIENFMPGMTMTFPVATAALMQSRAAGELITATLEVRDSLGTIVEITHTGVAPLPSDAEVAQASGILGVGDLVPDTAFVDQSDRRRSFSEWTGTATLVTFIYTSCPLPNFCPLMDQNFAALQRSITKDTAFAGRVKLVSISFDPDHDTPAVLAAHATRLRADPAVWTFLTGDRATIDRFSAKLGLNVLRPSDGSTAITHSLRTVLIGADGRIAKIYTDSDWTPGTVLADLRAMLVAR